MSLKKPTANPQRTRRQVRGFLINGRTHRTIENVRLELHQQMIAYHSSVRTQHGEPDSGILLHGVEHVACLKRCGFKEGAGEMAFAGKSRQAGNHARALSFQ